MRQIVSTLAQSAINNFLVWPAGEKNRSAYTQLILHDGFETDCNLLCAGHAQNFQVLWGTVFHYVCTQPPPPLPLYK